MPPIPPHTTPTLAAIQARRVADAIKFDQGDSPFIRISQAYNECARASWYDFRWASQGEGWSARMLRLFNTGHKEEARILADLETIEGVTVQRFDTDTGQQFEFDLVGYLRGHIDGIALGIPEAPKTWHLLECKSANEKNFKAIKSKGVASAKPEHWLQIQLYMAAAKLSRCLYFLVNKNDDEEYVERIKPDVEATERAIARLVGIAESPRPPGRIREDAIKPPCLWCRHKGVCHSGAQARMNCRTCLSSSPRPGGNWWCEFWSKELTPEQQGEGCAAHLWIPDLVAGEQTDADPENRTVTYRMASGETWVDGAKEVAV